MWCLCNNSQWMTINTTKQVFYLSCCEAVKTAPLPRADPPRQAVPCISMETAPRRGLLGKVLYSDSAGVTYRTDKRRLWNDEIIDTCTDSGDRYKLLHFHTDSIHIHLSLSQTHTSDYFKFFLHSHACSVVISHKKHAHIQPMYDLLLVLVEGFGNICA